jgi:hypothetical protein
MFLEPVQYVLGAFSGGIVGFTLGLFGGGGSILAVPLMVYLVGVPLPHVAIGTSAFSVAANAASNLMIHARKGNVIWRCAVMYAGAGVIGALLGSTLGKAIPGQHLLLLFSVLMVAIGLNMLRRRADQGMIGASCNREKAPKVLAYGGATGVVSGFFGIGGGFLIVPGLVASTGMPIINAIGSSLFAVMAFGLTTALSYAFSGLVDWPLAAVFIAGGALGGFAGARVAGALAMRQRTLSVMFAGLVIAVAGYMAFKSITAI